jgi:hypothetical protein
MASPVAAIIYASEPEPIGIFQRYDLRALALDTPEIAVKEQVEQRLPDLIEAQNIQEATLKSDQKEIMSKIK